MLHGPLKYQGYDWWWHSFTGRDETTGREKPFFIEFFVCNPALGGDEPVFGQLPKDREAGKKPSYLMVYLKEKGVVGAYQKSKDNLYHKFNDTWIFACYSLY